MRQLTLRDVDARVEALIRRIARDQNKSLSEVANQLLVKAAGLEGAPGKKRNLRALAGRWSEEEAAAFEKPQAVFDVIDAKLWKWPSSSTPTPTAPSGVMTRRR